MTEFNLQNIYLQALIHRQSPLISLYILKKSIQQELIREIQINSYLQNIVSQKETKYCKIQHKINDQQKEVSTQNKLTKLLKKNKRKIHIRKLKNDTKNIPKNFGKAIITFVEQNENVLRSFLQDEGLSYEVFCQALRTKKRGINSIADLRNLWLNQGFIYARQMRIISLHFLKRGSLSYVFSSRITNHEGHIKYRNRLIEVLRHPQQFTSIKTG